MKNKGTVIDIFQISDTDMFLLTLKGADIRDIRTDKKLQCVGKVNFIDSLPMICRASKETQDVTIGVLNNEFKIGDVLEII